MTTGNLTIQDNDTIDQYTSVGDTVFGFNFPILAADELKVSINQVLLTYGTDYTIAGFGADGGGTITMLAGPTTPGDIVTLWQDMPIQRLTGFSAGAAALLPEALNADLARPARVEQQLRREIRNSLRIAPDDPVGGQDMIIPPFASRPNKYLGFGADSLLALLSGTGNDSALRNDLANVTVGSQLVAQKLTAAEIAAGVTLLNPTIDPYKRGRYSSFGDWRLACDQAGGQGLLDADYAVVGTTELPLKCDFNGFEITGGFNTNRGPPPTIFEQGGYTLNWNAKQPRIQYAFFNDYSGIFTGLDDAGGVTMGGAGAIVGSSWNKIGVKYATSFVLDSQSSYITQNLITGGILRFIAMVGGGNELNANVFDNIDVSATTPAALAMGTVTVSNGTPAVVTWASHGKSDGVAVVFTTTGALPTGLSINTVYYVLGTGLTANTFRVSLTRGGAAINTSSAGSGVHTATSFGVLQTDTLRGRNIFRNIYWENGSNVRANAHIIGWHADGLGNPALDRYCHAMFNTNSNQRVITDFLSLSVSNLVTGGNWNILDAAGKPPDLSQGGGGAVSVIADNTDPSGCGLRYEVSFAGAFSGFTIVMQPSGSDRFSLVLYYKSTDDFFAVSSNDGGGSTSHDPTLSLVSQGLGNNWKKLWISGPASKTAGSSVTLFAYGAVGGAAKVMSISGMFAGSEGCVIPPQRQLTRNRFGSAVYDPPSLADGAGATTTVAVVGAALGDLVQASFSLNLQGILVTAWVSAADTVSVRFQNESGGVLDLASGTLRVQTQTPYA